MTNFCAYEHCFRGNRYEPGESWCEKGFDDECGEDCPHRYSKEDYEWEYADRYYDKYRDD